MSTTRTAGAATTSTGPKRGVKLLLLGVVAGAAYLIYRQVMASRAEEDLWSEATNAPDFSATYPPAGDAANGDPQ